MSLLGPDLVLEVYITCDSQGQVRSTTTPLDAAAPVEKVIAGMLASANTLAREAYQLAAERGVEVTVTPEGHLEVSRKPGVCQVCLEEAVVVSLTGPACVACGARLEKRFAQW